jgi:hypothetical protein
MSTADFDDAVERYLLAQGEFLKGDPEPVKELWSHRDDVSLANPYGPRCERGSRWPKDRACGILRRDGELVGIEILAQIVTSGLGYVVDIERTTAKIGSREDITPYALRATNIFRCEEGAGRWCIAMPTPSPRCSQRNRPSSSSSAGASCAIHRGRCGGPQEAVTGCVAQAYECRAALRHDEDDQSSAVMGLEWSCAQQAGAARGAPPRPR